MAKPFGKYVVLLTFLVFVSYFKYAFCFNILDYTHYIDYLPVRQEGLAGFGDTPEKAMLDFDRNYYHQPAPPAKAHGCEVGE